jgi:hypothetical protein
LAVIETIQMLAMKLDFISQKNFLQILLYHLQDATVGLFSTILASMLLIQIMVHDKKSLLWGRSLNPGPLGREPFSLTSLGCSLIAIKIKII